MQATTRSKQFIVDHRTVTVAVAIVVLIAVAGGAALLLTTTDTTNDSDAQPVVAAARPSGLTSHHPTDRSHSLSGVTQPDGVTQSDLDRATRLDQFYEAKMAHLDALEAQASKHTEWTAFPGHAGFTNDSTSRLDKTGQMERFYNAKMARLEADELHAAVMAAQADAARRQLEMDRTDYLEFVRLH